MNWTDKNGNIVNIGLLIVKGCLNSYKYLHMTDCAITFDHAIKEQNTIESNLKNYIKNSNDLFNLYFLLSKSGVENLKNHFSFIFENIESNHINTFELSVNDFNFVKKLYY